jgi:UDP-N-acetyl-D-mannosaminouronate:lipid I N-acetyl-D-mannosaminouronosyltransferase
MTVLSVNNINVHAFSDRSQLIDYAGTTNKILIAINAEKILNATDETRLIINENLGYTDGIGAVWALKKKGIKDVVKIPGCELWLDIVRNFYQNKSFYLIGAKETTIQETVKKLRSEFQGINITGFRNGYILSQYEKDKLISDILDKKPDVVFVAMGSPKQELFMQEIQKHHKAIYQGLGGSFDVYVGNVERAPEWWINHNLEWAYRLVKQPSRIKRQIHLIKFLWLLLLNRI